MPSEAGWQRTLRALSRPKVAVMLALGFSSGLPFLLVGNTLGFWLREGGFTLTSIGFLSWAGLAYSLKFLWAPMVDRVTLPLLGTRLGHRRGWMLAAQLVIAAGLTGMALIGPQGSLVAFAAMAVIAAFAAATQDIVIDAWRIESADSTDDLAVFSAAYQLGFRAAILLTDALILLLADAVGWPLSYGFMAATMSVGVVACLFAPEPSRAAVEAALWTLRGLFDAIVGPFVAFLKTHGRWALLMLLAISLYRLPDFLLGPMANPFYVDLGLTKTTVGAVRSSVGLIASIAGIAAGGLCAARLGLGITLLAGAVLGPASNLAFSVLALVGPDAQWFASAMFIDNFATGFAGTALVGYMSSLTSLGYTATQYALLSSFYALLGKSLKGLSGLAVDALGGDLHAYALFFAGTAAMGIPALLLCWPLARRRAVA